MPPADLHESGRASAAGRDPDLLHPGSAILPHEPAAVALLPDRRRLVLRVALVAAVLALLVLATASLPGLGEVRSRLAHASSGWLVLALALESASCLACVVVLRAVFCRRLPWRLSYEVAMAAQGTNVLLPTGGAGGLAVVAWALRRTGMRSERIGRRTVAFFVLTSGVNFVTAALVGGLLALGILAGGEPAALTAGPALAAALVVAGVLSLPRVLAASALSRQRAGRLGRILTTVRGALNALRDAVTLVRSGNPQVVGGAIGYMAFDVASLAAAFAAIGQVPPIGVLLLAYVIGQLGGLVPLPGGVGGADGGLIAALVLYGTPLSSAAAAVLAYRVFQLGLPALLGAVSLARLPGVVERAPDTGPLCDRGAAPLRRGAVAAATQIVTPRSDGAAGADVRAPQDDKHIRRMSNVYGSAMPFEAPSCASQAAAAGRIAAGSRRPASA